MLFYEEVIEMSNVIESVLKHPIATVFIISTTAHSVASIIGAAKGNNVQPFIHTNINTSAQEKEKQ